MEDAGLLILGKGWRGVRVRWSSGRAVLWGVKVGSVVLWRLNVDTWTASDCSDPNEAACSGKNSNSSASCHPPSFIFPLHYIFGIILQT
jgi:hypothetical protein